MKVRGVVLSSFVALAAACSSPAGSSEGAQSSAAAVTIGTLAPTPAWIAQQRARFLLAMSPAGYAHVRGALPVARAAVMNGAVNPLAAAESAVRANLAAAGPSALEADSPDVAAMAVLVLALLVQDADDDLQLQMQNAQEQMQTKEALRALVNALDEDLAALAQAPSLTSSDACLSSVVSCAQAVDDAVGADPAVVAAVAQVVATTFPVEVGTSFSPISACAAAGVATTCQLGSIVQSLQDQLDSDNEISEMTSMQLQMLMDARSKLLQTASDIEKTMADTASAVVQNIKQ